MNDPRQVWEVCSGDLRTQVTEATWKTWFDEVRPVIVDDSVLVLEVPSSIARERLENRYLPLLEDTVAAVVGRPLEVQIRVGVNLPSNDAIDAIDLRDEPGAGERTRDRSVDHAHDPDLTTRPGHDRRAGDQRPGPAPRPQDRPWHTGDGRGRWGNGEPGRDRGERATTPSGGASSGGAGPPALSDQHPASAGGGTAGSEENPLIPRYTFDAFVPGQSNRFAHAAALAVAERPAKSYNPLFIYGDSGLGKTHLLHAIGHYVRENFPNYRVRYVSTETFLNEFVDAIRTNAGLAFKRRYRECDVLLVDDVQFLEGKEGLQEEFFHTFNHLHGAARQLIISSDRHPRSIATLEDRLRSRFEWGLLTDVQPPELETRLAILRKKAEGERAHVPDEVLELIATHVKDNIRELEGALIRVSAFASLNREPLTAHLAEMVLSDLLSTDQPRRLTPQLILNATSEFFGFEVDELRGTSRRRPLVIARQVGMYLMRDLTDFSYPAIGREFGGRDHTTVIHAVDKISGLMKERRQIYEQVTELLHMLKSGR